MLLAGTHRICRRTLLLQSLQGSTRCFTVDRGAQAKHSKKTLPTSPARTRFAPSPTGYLHLGSLRTALFNYLLAKKTGGQFLLRIEDTDQKRTVPGAVERLCSDLKWAGLQWDEGPDTDNGSFGPYIQSQRTPLYQGHAHKLLESGHAYRCFCTAERLDDLARQRKELGLPTDYDRTCAGIPKQESDSRAAAGEGHVIRLLAPDVYPDMFDLVYGRIGKAKGLTTGVTVKHGETAYEDPVLLKSDGQPTYHLANVVDDHFMEITHVVRATEWISSTPKHLALYKAFGWEPPAFAHVGLLVDEAGHKLSKRNFDTDIAHFRELGILPSTLVNFVALLGWSHSQRSDIMTLQQLVDQFQMQFTKGNTTVTLEKLWFLQRSHATRATVVEGEEFDDMARRIEVEVKDLFENMSITSGNEPLTRTGSSAAASTSNANQQTSLPVELNTYVRGLLKIDAKNYSTPAEFVSRNCYFFTEPTWNIAFLNNSENVATTSDLAASAKSFLSQCTEINWTTETINHHMKATVSSESQKPFASNLSHTPPVSSQLEYQPTSITSRDQMSAASAEEAPPTTITNPLRTPSKEALAREKAYNKLFHDFLRWILLGGKEGPGSAATMALLGKEVCVRRFDRALEALGRHGDRAD